MIVGVRSTNAVTITMIVGVRSTNAVTITMIVGVRSTNAVMITMIVDVRSTNAVTITMIVGVRGKNAVIITVIGSLLNGKCFDPVLDQGTFLVPKRSLMLTSFALHSFQCTKIHKNLHSFKIIHWVYVKFDI